MSGPTPMTDAVADAVFPRLLVWAVLSLVAIVATRLLVRYLERRG